jgi:hypothetical protein
MAVSTWDLPWLKCSLNILASTYNASINGECHGLNRIADIYSMLQLYTKPLKCFCSSLYRFPSYSSRMEWRTGIEVRALITQPTKCTCSYRMNRCIDTFRYYLRPIGWNSYFVCGSARFRIRDIRSSRNEITLPLQFIAFAILYTCFLHFECN